MIVRDSRDPQGRDEGPYQSRGWLGLGASDVGASVEGGDGLGGLGPELSEGRCPICGIKMTKGNQRTCIKLPKDNSWGAMRTRGRGGYRFGRSRKAD